MNITLIGVIAVAWTVALVAWAVETHLRTLRLRYAIREHHVTFDAPRLPDDAELCEMAHCPAEDRTRYHAIHADDTRTCWTCATITARAEETP